MDYLLLLLGLVVLIAGGEFLVRGAVGCSSAFKISPLVIGMTVVSFGTSAPELIVSIDSALSGNPGIAMGNVVGSNIANIALVLGLTALIFPIVAGKQTKSVDYPMMILASILFYIFSLDFIIVWWEGVILFGILSVFIYLMISTSRKKTKKAIEEEAGEFEEAMKFPMWKSLLFLAVGLVGLFFGAGWFVDGAVGIAEILLEGNPDKDTIIGVTVVALGTSAPELVASVVAAFRKQTDIALGNLIGSNIFNIFAVIGLTSIVKPIEISQSMLSFDLLWMLGISFLLLFVLAFGKRIGRFKGAVLTVAYLSYVAMILLRIKGIV